MRLVLSLIAAAALAGSLAACGGSGAPRPDLVFVSSRTHAYELWEMNADGGRQRRLTHGGSDENAQRLFWAVDPAWSPDGSEIAFASKREGSFDIYVMSRDGKGVRRLTEHAKDDDSHPSWSPDGKRIAFARGGAIYVMHADGTHVHEIAGGSQRAGYPAWSPNGKWIAFALRARAATTINDIWLVRPDGSDARQLTKLPRSSVEPSWSPTSTSLAFASNAPGGPSSSIYTVRTDGTHITRVTAGADDNDPAWSPDGRTIALARDGAIASVAAGGGEVKVLTDAENNDSSPAWNPVQDR